MKLIIPKNLHKLLLKGRRYKVAKGQIIQSSDYRPVFNFVESGYVKRYLIANDGSHGIQSIYGPGDFFPLTLVFKELLDMNLYEGPEVHYYEAMTDTEVYTVNSDILAEATEKDATLYKDLLTVSGRRLHSNIQRLENLTLKHSYKRVAHHLAYFAREFGKKTTGGTKILLPLTHQDLANVLSATRETTSLGILRLRKKGLIKTGKHIIVPSIEKLEDEAYS